MGVTIGVFTSSIFNTVGALIGMIPDGLLLLTSSVMAVSVIRLSRVNVLVQQLYCIETLARVDVICLDKTGTITMGEMEVIDVIPSDGVSIEEMDEALSNLAYAFNNSNGTMDAIKKYYKDKGVWTVKERLEFSSSRKFSSASFYEHGIYFMGASEFVLKSEIGKYTSEIDKYIDYRVLVVAKSMESDLDNPEYVKVIGFILLQDKIREEAPDTLKYFKEQGVKVKIISGDNFKTVTSIARRAGLADALGMDASLLTEDNICENVKKYDVFGRVKPEQKKMIVEALQKEGHVVAMTGDGVNDVLALKQSDCSIAVASGTDAAKNVSQLVLLDSNFSSLPKVVAEGRRTINNIGRSASLLLTKTLFTIILILICIITASEYFFVPIQLTLITAFTIGIPSFILALEPNKERVRGNFLIKIIGKSIPAALTVVFNIVIILLFQELFHFDEGITTNLAVFLTAATGFIFLYRICEPFNKLRTVLYIALLLGFSYAALFHYEFFELNKLSLETTILFIILLFSSLFIFEKLNRLMQIILEKLEEKYENKKNETSFKKF